MSKSGSFENNSETPKKNSRYFMFSLIFDWWHQATWETRIFTFFRGNFVGKDHFGNRYYEEKKSSKKILPHWHRARRWAVYSGIAEASAIPPGWNAWLQHTSNDIPEDGDERYSWEQEHIPNLTGTSAAYRPPGSILEGGKRSKATGDYEHWRPE